jgi:ABC-type nitrate/sulfonate/bicarbonate transport system substrate-binding protein
MPYRPTRRAVLTSCLALAALAAPVPVVAQDKVIKMGSLKLIHSIAPHFYEKFTPAGYKVEIIPFESPTECKNAVVTKSVDFGFRHRCAIPAPPRTSPSGTDRNATRAWQSRRARMARSRR